MSNTEEVMGAKRYFWQADGLGEYGYGSMYPEDPSYPTTELIEKSDFDRVTAERDALQQLLNARDEEVGVMRRQLDALLNHCEDGECVTCAAIICPVGDGMHFHHDGCPGCAEAEAEQMENQA